MLRAATRGSPLARWQAQHVADMLDVEVELVVVETSGDRERNVPISEVGGRGVFVREVQHAVLNGDADFAVHSAKDLQSAATPGLDIVAVPLRGDVRDALVGSTLDAIPDGGVVATGSVRRKAQLASLRPDLTFADLRGNIGTRLEKASSYDAIVVAYVALERLGRLDQVADVLDWHTLIPQVGQGALAVECRSGDDLTRSFLQAVDHEASHQAVAAERAWLQELGGGCDLPVGAHARLIDGELALEAMIASFDGSTIVRASSVGDDPVTMGSELAKRMLEQMGGRQLLLQQSSS